MNNLFSIFDPASGILGLRLNWLSLLGILLVPTMYWITLNKRLLVLIKALKFLVEEINAVLFLGVRSSSSIILISAFAGIALNNFLGLLPYVFTASSHLSVTLSLALPFWVGYILLNFINNTRRALAHLVPGGTPAPLVPFMVLIEIVRNLIRPLTLGIRLAANIVAGHLLLALVRGPMPQIRASLWRVRLLGLLALIVLEFGVSLIQAYVFITLSSLYIGEVNNPNN